jgi:NADPH-dependent curcumin reductase CurA
VALRAEWLSVDPYLRGRMREGAKSYVPPFELNKPIVSGIVARVIASKDDNFKVGDRAISTSPHTHTHDRTRTRTITRFWCGSVG